MNDLQTHVTDYLDYCQNQKRLDAKTLRAYRIDLSQFCTGLFCASSKSIADTNAACHCIFVSSIFLHSCLSPKFGTGANLHCKLLFFPILSV